MTSEHLTNEALAAAPQYQLDEWRYNADPLMRRRARAESYRRLRVLLAGAA